MSIVVQYLDRRSRERAAERLAELRRLRAVLPEVVRLLGSRFGVRRVILIGSVARGDLSGDLDLDLAVEGLRPEEHWQAVAEVGRTAGAEVDIIPLEGASAAWQATIAAEGEVLLG